MQTFIEQETHGATYQDDGPDQVSTENVDVLPFVENHNLSCLWEEKKKEQSAQRP